MCRSLVRGCKGLREVSVEGAKVAWEGVGEQVAMPDSVSSADMDIWGGMRGPGQNRG